MSNTITIELCAEDRARLDGILEALKAAHPNCEGCVQSAIRMTAATKAPEFIKDEHPALDPFPQVADVKPEAIPAEEVAPAEPSAAPEYKLTDIQQKVVQLSAAGKKAEVRDIVKAYAEKVSAIPEDKFDDVMTKLKGLEG